MEGDGERGVAKAGEIEISEPTANTICSKNPTGQDKNNSECRVLLFVLFFINYFIFIRVQKL